MFSLENSYFTDCILRNKIKYRYLMRLDPDEIPILKKYKTIPELIKSNARR